MGFDESKLVGGWPEDNDSDVLNQYSKPTKHVKVNSDLPFDESRLVSGWPESKAVATNTKKGSFIGDVGTVVAGGLYDLAEMGLRGIRAIPGGPESGGVDPNKPKEPGFLDRAITGMENFQKETPWLQTRQGTSGIGNAIREGARSAVTSLGTAAPGVAIGSAFGPAGALAGGLISYVAGAPLFGLAEYDSFVEQGLNSDAYKQGRITKDQIEEKAMVSGLAEGGIEFAANALEAATLGGAKALSIGGKQALKQGIKSLMKEGIKSRLGRMAANVGFEVGGEMLTGGIQAEQYNLINETDQSFIKGAADAFGPSFVASMIFLGFGEAGVNLHRKDIQKRLENANEDPRVRNEAVRIIAEDIRKVSPVDADIWQENAMAAVAQGQPISTDEAIVGAQADEHFEGVKNIQDEQAVQDYRNGLVTKIENIDRFKKPSESQLQRRQAFVDELASLDAQIADYVEQKNINNEEYWAEQEKSILNQRRKQDERNMQANKPPSMYERNQQTIDQVERWQNRTFDIPETDESKWKEIEDDYGEINRQRQLRSNQPKQETQFDRNQRSIEDYDRWQDRDFNIPETDESSWKRLEDDENYWSIQEKEIERQKEAKDIAYKLNLLRQKKKLTKKDVAIQSRLEERFSEISPVKNTVAIAAKNRQAKIDRPRQDAIQSQMEAWDRQGIDVPQTDHSQYREMENEERYWDKQKRLIEEQRKGPTQAQRNQARINAQLSDEEQVTRDRNQYMAGQSDFQQKLDMMQAEVNGSQTKGVNVEQVGRQSETIAYSASSPRWMQQIQQDRKKRGAKALSRDELNILFNKARTGQPMTERQQDQWFEVEKAVNDYTRDAGEFVEAEKATDLERSGFEIYGGQQMQVSSLNPGDIFRGTVNGETGEFTVQGVDESGMATIQGKNTHQIDISDHVKVDGIKRGAKPEGIGPISKSELEQEGYDVSIKGERVPVTDLKPGDKIVGTIDGVKDEYTVKGINDNGEVLFQDGITRRLDMFDEVSVDGIKRNNTANASESSAPVAVASTKPEQAPKKSRTGNQFTPGATGDNIISEPTTIGLNEKGTQLDLFNKEAKGVQLDLFEYRPTAKEKIETQRELRAQKGLRTKQEVSTSPISGMAVADRGFVARSPEDAASLLSHLVKSAQENAYFLPVDKDGNVLEFLLHSVGLKGASQIDPVQGVGRVFQNKNSTKIFFVHNHPSGSVKPSPQDIEITKKIQDIANLRDIEIVPMVIGRNGFSVFDTFGDFRTGGIKKTITKAKLPITERIFTKTLSETNQAFKNAEEFRDRMKSEQDGFMFVNNNLEEVGFLPFPSGLPRKEISAQVIAAAEKTNASGMFVNNKPSVNAKGRDTFLKTLSDALHKNGVETYDILSWNEDGSAVHNPQDIYREASETAMGKLNQDKVQYQIVHHGTPHTWEPEPGFPHGRPRLDKIGTGEGAAAYGWGWYSADSIGVAEEYKKELSKDQRKYLLNGVPFIPKSSDTKEAIKDAFVFTDGTMEDILDFIESRKDSSAAPHLINEDLKTIGKGKIELVEGSLYKLDIPDEVIPKLLDWDKPLSDQSDYVKKSIISSLGSDMFSGWSKDSTGEIYTYNSQGSDPLYDVWKSGDKWKVGTLLDRLSDNGKVFDSLSKAKEFVESRRLSPKNNIGKGIYDILTKKHGSKKAASEYLASIGIPGNKYLDGMSRGEGKGSYNYVIWDQDVLDKIALLERNGEKLDAMRLMAESKSKIDTNPGQNITQDQIKAQYSKQDVTPNEDGSLSIRFQNGKGVRVNTVEHIGGDDIRIAMETGRMGRNGIILGKFENDTITLNLNAAGYDTHIHELKHMLDQWGVISKAENNVLDIEMKRLVREGKYNYEVKNDLEEDRANTLAQIVEDRKNYRDKGILYNIIQKVTDFIDSLLNIGRASADKLARDVESQRVFSREEQAGVNEFAQNQKLSVAKAVDRIKNMPAFKKWFGNSKVADDNGDPLVVYHGSDIDITEFSKSVLGSTTGAKSASKGFFFTDNKETAKTYADHGFLGTAKLGKTGSLLASANRIRYESEQDAEFTAKTISREILARLSPVKRGKKTSQMVANAIEERYSSQVAMFGGVDILSEEIKRVSGLESTPSQSELKNEYYDLVFNTEKTSASIQAELSKGVKAYYLSIKNPYIYDFKGENYREETYANLLTKARTTIKGQKRHDGAIFKNTFDAYGGDKKGTKPYNVFVAFNPTQIKSIYNTGTWDGTNPDIRYQIDSNDKAIKNTKAIEDIFKEAESSGDKTYLRLTSNPDIDMERQTSIHMTDATSLEEAVEMTGLDEDELIELEDGSWGQIIDGLAAFEVESVEDIENILSDSSNANADIIPDDNRFAYLFIGEDAGGDVPDGTSFYPKKYIRIKTNKDVRYSTSSDRTSVIDEDSFTLSGNSTLMDDAEYNVIDEMAPISKVYKAIKDAGRTISEKADFKKRERLRTGKSKTRIDSGKERFNNPILETIGKHNLTTEDAGDFLYARHVPEANERLRRTNAKAYLEDLAKFQKGEGLTKKIKELEARFDLQELPTHELQNAYLDLLESELDIENIQAHINEAQAGLETAQATDDEKKIEFAQKRLNRANNEMRLKNRWDEFKAKPSGMTDGYVDPNDNEAADLIKKWGNHPGMKKIARLFDQMNAEKLNILHDAGRLSDEEYQAIKGTYEYYAPLKREGFEKDRAMKGIGTGVTGLGVPVKVRGGSTRRAVHILANAFVDYQKAVIDAEKADVARSFIEFVKEHPNKDFWSFEEPKTEAYYDGHGNIKRRVSRNIDDGPGGSELKIKVDGKTMVLTANKENIHAMRIFSLIRGDQLNSGKIVNAFGKLNRFLAQINTSWNPEFMLTNLPRDVQTALMNLNDTPIKNMQKAVFKNIPKAMKGLHSYTRGDKSHEWASLVERYEKSGAKIGWIDYGSDIESAAKDLEKQVDLYREGHQVKKTLNKIVKLVEDYNSIVENAVRLSVFKSGIDAGMSESDSAIMSKGITVDFNRRGHWGPAINSMYLFANAGIQGSTRIVKAMINNPGRMSKILGSAVGAAAGLAVLNSLSGGYDDIDDEVKKRNIVILLPGSNGHPIKIPLPWGYNVFWALGTELGDMFVKDDYSALEGASRMVSTAMDAFNPLQSGSILQTLAPTFADPVVMAQENKAWHGGPLMPAENTFARVKKPDSQRYFKTVRPVSKNLAEFVNWVTFGNKGKSGFVDVSPETLDMVWDTFIGGAGKFWTDTAMLPINVISGEGSIKRTPGLRRFVGEKSEYKTGNDYRKNTEYVYSLQEQLKIYPERRKELQADKAFRLINNAKRTDSYIKKLRDDLKRTKTKKGQERIELLIEKAQKDFNQKFYAVKNN